MPWPLRTTLWYAVVSYFTEEESQAQRGGVMGQDLNWGLFTPYCPVSQSLEPSGE